MENKSNKYKDELRNLAPDLSEIEKKEPYSVHDDYFDELSSRIADRIRTETVDEKRIAPAIVFRYVSAAVFSVVILAVTFIYVNRNENQASDIAEIELSTDELITSAYFLGMDEYNIKETVAHGEADLNNIFAGNDDIENYLLDQGIDESLINEL